MTPEFASRSFMIIRSSMIIFGMVVGMSISTNAETVKVMDEASTDGSFTIAQTNGAGAPGHPAELPSGEWGRRRGQAPLQTDGTPELVAALPRVAYQRHQGVALCHPLGVRGSLLPVIQRHNGQLPSLLVALREKNASNRILR